MKKGNKNIIGATVRKKVKKDKYVLAYEILMLTLFILILGMAGLWFYTMVTELK